MHFTLHASKVELPHDGEAKCQIVSRCVARVTMNIASSLCTLQSTCRDVTFIRQRSGRVVPRAILDHRDLAPSGPASNERVYTSRRECLDARSSSPLSGTIGPAAGELIYIRKSQR